MPAPASNQELLTLIAKTGVFDAARVQVYMTELAAQPGGVPADPAKLAARMVRDGILSTFQAENLLAGRWKRFAIGKYKVLERLGVGGMGQVFLCEHKLMKRKVAVKVLPAAKAKDQAALQRFYREARAVAAMDHPNLVRAYDIDQDQNLHFLVMEFVDGANLHDIVRRSGPLPVARACHYVYATAVGLQHAHEMGLVHRDVKPANVLVDRTGVVKILDMGLARFFDPDENDHLTKKYDENVLGTADYLAPEQAIDSSAADIRADLYALGGTFYFLLTGQPPFPDGSVAQKLLAHQSRTPKPVTEFRPDVPPGVAAVIDKLMAKDPADRYQTPNELMAALTPWVQTPIPPPPEHEMPQLSAAAVAGLRPGSSSNQLATGEQYRQNPLVLAPASPSAPPRPPVAKPAAAKPVAAPVARPQADDPANPWESITSPETLPTSSQPTGKNQPGAEPAAAPAGRSRGRIPPAKSPLKPVLIAAVAGGVLLLLGGGAAVLYFFNPFGGKSAPTAAATKPRESRTWYVSAAGTGPDPDSTRKSLKDLGKELKPGDTIVFLDDTFESDALVIRSVNLEAGNATRSVTWVYKPDGGKPPAAVLDLTGGGTTVRGLTIDAGGQCDYGVLVRDTASGMTIENVTVKNARKLGIRIHNANADGQPVRIANCRVTAGDTADGAVAVTGTTRTGTVGVELNGCRLEGANKGAAILIEGNVTRLEVKNCRAFQFAAGVSVLTVGDRMDVTVERNTFHTLAAGLKVDQPLTLNTPIVLRQNYFGATAEVGKVAGDPLMVKAESNGRDAGSQDGNLTTPVANGVVPKPKPDDPVSKFLVPAARVTVGEPKTPIGAD